MYSLEVAISYITIRKHEKIPIDSTESTESYCHVEMDRVQRTSSDSGGLCVLGTSQNMG